MASIAAPKVLRVRGEVMIGSLCDFICTPFASFDIRENAKVSVAKSREFAMLLNDTLKVILVVPPFDFFAVFFIFVLVKYVLRKMQTRTIAK